MPEVLVSVVIPCYNQGAFVDEAVKSVLQSDYEHVEIIIVNDGSTDDFTNKLLEKYQAPKTRVIKTSNQKLPSARNNGIKQASGKYILALDADDKIHPHYIRTAVDILEKCPEVGIVRPETEFFGAKSGKFYLPRYHLRRLLFRNLLVCSCLFRREDWEKVGGYNVNMIYGWEDWDFWLSVIERGRKVYELGEVMFYYRQHEVSMASETSISNEKQNFSCQRLIENHPRLYHSFGVKNVDDFRRERFRKSFKKWLLWQVINLRYALIADKKQRRVLKEELRQRWDVA